MKDIDIYSQMTRTTAIYPFAGSGTTIGLMYCALGLAGEAGEIANKVKKLFRDTDDPSARESLRKEIGDVAWYLARLSDELGFRLSDILSENVDKLQTRKSKGTLGGSGDER